MKLAKLLYEDINLLILDEPTNHLDTASIETIEEALTGFKGTIFFISHDRYFINKLGERVIAVEDFGFKSYEGNYDAYKKGKEETALGQRIEPLTAAPSKGKAQPKQQRASGEAYPRAVQKAELEENIEQLEQAIKDLDQAMSEPEIAYEELNTLYTRREEMARELDYLMELWMSLE